MKGNKQADPNSVCLWEITRGKRTWEYARHAEATNQPNLSPSLFPQQCFSLSFSELTSITHAGDSVSVCVHLHKIVCLWKNMDEEMEMRVLWSVGLLHPHLKARGYLIDGLYVCDS